MKKVVGRDTFLLLLLFIIHWFSIKLVNYIYIWRERETERDILLVSWPAMNLIKQFFMIFPLFLHFCPSNISVSFHCVRPLLFLLRQSLFYFFDFKTFEFCNPFQKSIRIQNFLSMMFIFFLTSMRQGIFIVVFLLKLTIGLFINLSRLIQTRCPYNAILFWTVSKDPKKKVLFLYASFSFIIVLWVKNLSLNIFLSFLLIIGRFDLCFFLSDGLISFFCVITISRYSTYIIQSDSNLV